MTKQPNEWQELIGAIAEVCGKDLDLETHAKMCGKAGKQVRSSKKNPATPELIKEKYGENSWWFKFDFRGQRGSLPTPMQIVETWGIWEKQNGHSGNGKHDKPSEVRSIYNSALAAAREADATIR